MPLTEHLAELRKVAIRVLIIILVSFAACYAYGDKIAEILLIPLKDTLGKIGGKGEIVLLDIFDKVLAQLQVAFWSCLIVSAPLWFREVWSFIKPGLYDREIKVIRPFIFVGFLLFILGVAFGYFIVFPLTFEALLTFNDLDAVPQMSLKGYLVLCCKVLVMLGIVFQLPNVMLILGFMGVVTKQSLRNMRPYVYVGFSMLSAMLTPPDPMTMLMLWIPLVILFEFGILAVAILVHPWLAKRVENDDLNDDQSEQEEIKEETLKQEQG